MKLYPTFRNITTYTAWVKDGWIVLANPSRRTRSYKLSEIYQKYIRNNFKE